MSRHAMIPCARFGELSKEGPKGGLPVRKMTFHATNNQLDDTKEDGQEQALQETPSSSQSQVKEAPEPEWQKGACRKRVTRGKGGPQPRGLLHQAGAVCACHRGQANVQRHSHGAGTQGGIFQAQTADKRGAHDLPSVTLSQEYARW